MIINIKTSNGEMNINTEEFFPATKAATLKLRKAIVDKDDLRRVAEAVKSMIVEQSNRIDECMAKIKDKDASLELYQDFGNIYMKEFEKIAFWMDEYKKAVEKGAKLRKNFDILAK